MGGLRERRRTQGFAMPWSACNCLAGCTGIKWGGSSTPRLTARARFDDIFSRGSDNDTADAAADFALSADESSGFVLSEIRCSS